MKTGIKITPTETGLGIQGTALNLNGEEYKYGFHVSFEETSAQWEDAKKWCEERGGKLPSVEQAIILARHWDEINEVLKETEKETLGGWHWTDREYHRNPNSALVVGMGRGSVGVDFKAYDGSVRAVSAFSFE